MCVKCAAVFCRYRLMQYYYVEIERDEMNSCHLFEADCTSYYPHTAQSEWLAKSHNKQIMHFEFYSATKLISEPKS